MSTRGIKTVLLILLCGANIFLVFNIVQLNLRVRNIPADMIQNAADILRSHRIYADTQRIPARRPVNYIYTGVYTPDNYPEIVRSFSRASEEEIWAGSHSTPEGWMVFHAGDYKFGFEGYNQTRITRIDYWGEGDIGEIGLFMGYTDSDAIRVRAVISDFLRRYSEQDARVGFEIMGIKQEGIRDKVRINQTVSGFLISPHTADVIISGGEVRYFSGRWYFGELAVVRERPPLLDAVNILFRSLEQDGAALSGARLESMEEQYSINILRERNRIIFVPSWVISFYGGSDESGEADIRKFSYDMVRGSRNNFSPDART